MNNTNSRSPCARVCVVDWGRKVSELGGGVMRDRADDDDDDDVHLPFRWLGRIVMEEVM